MSKSSKSRAIRLFCLDHSGDSPKGVTLCRDVACPLWAHRFGCSDKSKKYKARMEKARRRYPREYMEIQKLLSDANKK